MLKSKLDKIILGNQFVALELFSVNAENGIACLTIENKKDELIIISKEKRSNFEKLNNKPGKGVPVYLVINTSDVIQKEVDSVETSDSKILHKAFPNIKTEDFFFQISRFEQKSIVAICRKTYLEGIQNDLTNQGIIITSISLGVCSIISLKEFCQDEVLKTNTQTVFFNESDSDSLLEINQNNATITYDINSLEVQNTYILSFSFVLQNLLKLKVTGNIERYNEISQEAFYQKSFFNKTLKGMVYFLLCILLLNFFTFNYYYKKADQTSSNVEANKELILKIKQVKDRLKNKEEKLNQASNDSDSKTSLLISQIVEKLPSSILLYEFNYHPLLKNIKEEEPINLESNVITISGKTLNNSNLSDWIEDLEGFRWMKKVTIMYFGKDENNDSIFTIKLEINSNEKTQ